MFDKDGGRIIFFEGTYTTTFSGNNDPTPRYDYNQIMYQLDLSDPRLALPVAIYEIASSPGGASRLATKTSIGDRETWTPRPVAFFAPDRQGIALLPVYEQSDAKNGQSLSVPANGVAPDRFDARPLFFVLPADIKDYTAATAPFYEYREEGSGRRVYSVDAPSAIARSRWTPKLLGRVWQNPARSRHW
jgi:hypothetical protein